MIGLMRKIFGKIKVFPPQSCSVVITTQCCLKCKMCYMWQSLQTDDELSFEETKRIIDQASELLEGNREFIISGGEPLLVPYVFELIEHARKAGLKVIMPTNGFLLNDDYARRLCEVGLDELFISLDSQNHETHDFLRGRENVFYSIQNGIKLLDKYKKDLRVNFLTVISNKNYSEIIDHLHTIKRDKRISGVYFQAVAAPFFTNAGSDWRENKKFSFLWPEKTAEINKVIDEIIRLKKEENYPVHNSVEQLKFFKKYFKDPYQRIGAPGCILGERVLNVDPQGNISLCCFNEPVGNIRKNSLSEVWYSDSANKERKWMRNCNKNCHNTVNCFFEDEA